MSDLHLSSLGCYGAHGEMATSRSCRQSRFAISSVITPQVSGAGMSSNAIRFAVADIGHAEATLAASGIKPQRHVGRLVVPPEAAFGATLIFQPANKA